MISEPNELLKMSEYELSKFLESQKQQSKVAHNPISESAEFPLTYIQEQIWYIQNIDPNDRTYNLSRIITVNKGFDIDKFLDSIRQVIKRHCILRTVFFTKDGCLKQKIIPTEKYKLPVKHLWISEYEQEVCIEKNMEEVKYFPYRLDTGPLFVVRILQTEPEKAIIFFGIHHIICDGWSLNILLNEVMDNFLHSHNPLQAELPLQYIDIAVTQKEQKSSDIEALAEKTYQRLKDAYYLKLPFEQSVNITNKNGQRLVVPLNDLLCKQIADYCTHNKISMFSLFMAVFGITLFTYQEYKKIAISTTISCRDMVDYELLIGPFINTAFLDISINKKETFYQLTERIHLQSMDMQDNRHLPYNRFVAKMKPNRTLENQMIDQFGLDILNYPPALKVDGWEFSDIYNNTVRLDLYLCFFMQDNRISLDLQYNKNKFCHDDILNFQDRFIKNLQYSVMHVESLIGAQFENIQYKKQVDYETAYQMVVGKEVNGISNVNFEYIPQIEQKLLQIWKEVLQNPNISTEDDFFDVGGHSLLLITIFDEIKTRVWDEIEFIDIFDHSNIKSMAGFIASKKTDSENIHLNVTQPSCKKII